MFAPYLRLFDVGVTAHEDPDELVISPGPRRTLAPVQIERATAAWKIFGEFADQPLTDWLSDFEQERDPDYEIALWDEMVKAYTRFAGGKKLSREVHTEVMSILLSRTGESADAVLARLGNGLQHLSLTDAQQLLDGYTLMPHPVGVRMVTDK
jgi:hypothetical protein